MLWLLCALPAAGEPRPAGESRQAGRGVLSGKIDGLVRVARRRFARPGLLPRPLEATENKPRADTRSAHRSPALRRRLRGRLLVRRRPLAGARRGPRRGLLADPRQRHEEQLRGSRRQLPRAPSGHRPAHDLGARPPVPDQVQDPRRGRRRPGRLLHRRRLGCVHAPLPARHDLLLRARPRGDRPRRLLPRGHRGDAAQGQVLLPRRPHQRVDAVLQPAAVRRGRGLLSDPGLDLGRLLPRRRGDIARARGRHPDLGLGHQHLLVGGVADLRAPGGRQHVQRGPDPLPPRLSRGDPGGCSSTTTR